MNATTQRLTRCQTYSTIAIAVGIRFCGVDKLICAFTFDNRRFVGEKIGVCENCKIFRLVQSRTSLANFPSFASRIKSHMICVSTKSSRRRGPSTSPPWMVSLCKGACPIATAIRYFSDMRLSVPCRPIFKNIAASRPPNPPTRVDKISSLWFSELNAFLHKNCPSCR